MITCKDIFKRYGDSIILNGIDANLDRGQITVLIGPSGSGKTTLLKSLSLIENPSSGKVTLDGESFEFPKTKAKVRKQFFYSGKQKVGVVFQNLDLIPHWSNRENILIPLGQYISNSDKKELQNLLNLFKMQSFIDKLPHQCSKGEQQRVAFVRAVMLKPQFLFLDEITSALDPELIASLFKYLIELKDKGTGILIITHFLLFAQNVADKIIFIDKGQIIEQGTRDIMISPSTKKLQDFLLSLNGIILNTRYHNLENVTKGVLDKNKKIYHDFNESNDVNKKLRLVYILLNQEKLDSQTLKELYRFINNNFLDFQKDLEKSLNSARTNEEYWTILDQYINENLSNPKYPKHKAWVYLLGYKTSDGWRDKDLKPLLESFQDTNYPVNNMVATEMIKELK